jgi:Mn2+/Fe2+ NRAMP family transporter
MRSFLSTVPWFIPVMAAGIALALLTARPVAARLGSSWVAAFVLIASAASILGATITPDASALASHAVATPCDLSRITPAPPATYLRIGEESLNVLLFVPLGLAIGLMPGRSRRVLGVGAVMFIVGIELTQLLVVPLGRGCQTADIVDNLAGLLVGICTASVIRSAPSRKPER